MRRRFLGFLALAAALTAFGGENDRDQELRNKQAAQAAAIAEHRGKLIRREIARVSSGRSWGGEYYLGDGLGVNQTLVVAPQAGFVFEWQGCLGLYDRNYGAVSAADGQLELKCELPNHPRDGFQGLNTRLIPVKWGKRHYLIAHSELTRFCNAYNAGDEPRQRARGDFFLRRGDETKPAPGKPPLPAEYAVYLLDKPITAKVVEVQQTSYREGKYGTRWRSTPVVIDAGRTNGVYPGAEFFIVDKDSVASATVTQLDDRTSKLVFDQDTSSEELAPTIGCKLSMKPPWR